MTTREVTINRDESECLPVLVHNLSKVFVYCSSIVDFWFLKDIYQLGESPVLSEVQPLRAKPGWALSMARWAQVSSR